MSDARYSSHGGITSSYTVSGFIDNNTVTFSTSTNSTLIGYMIIDLSDTTNWPHTKTGAIVLDSIEIQVDPETNFRGEIKVGYLSNVDATNGDFNTVINVSMNRKSDIFEKSMVFGANGVHCQNSQHFGPVIANSTLFQTDTNLTGPDGAASYPAGNGDFCLIVDGNGTDTVDVDILVGYRTHE
jgi:hypothetical protein